MAVTISCGLKTVDKTSELRATPDVTTVGLSIQKRAADIAALLESRPALPRYGAAASLDDMLNVMVSPRQPQIFLSKYWDCLRCKPEEKLAPFDAKVRQFVAASAPKSAHLSEAAIAFLPAAIIKTLAAIAPSGWLYAGSVAGLDCCEVGRACVAAVFGAGYEPAPPGARHKLRYLDAKTRVALLSSRAVPDCLAQMPALTEMVQAYRDIRPFKDLSMAVCQHLFPSNGAMVQALELLGCNRASAHFFAKRTSVNEEVKDQLVAEGWSITHPCAGQEMAQAINLLRDLLRRSPEKRVLIIDEGAKFITALHRAPDLLAQAKRFVCVEQTESGVKALEAMAAQGQPLEVPVWNVARSYLKKHQEAGFIGEDVVQCALEKLSATGSAYRARTATVLGYGAVGTMVALALKRRGFAVGVFDIDPDRNEAAQRDGYFVSDRQTLFARGPVVFGCANSIRGGEPALTRQQMADWLPDGTVLINAGSGNYQWDLQAYASAAPQPDEDVRVHDGLRRAVWRGQTISLGYAHDDQPHRVLGLGERRILVFDSGYVVNRTRGVHPEFIDLTRALMVSACISAALTKSASPGLKDIDPAFQTRILRTVQTHLCTLGKSLEEPDLSVPAPLPLRHMAPAAQQRNAWENNLERDQLCKDKITGRVEQA